MADFGLLLKDIKGEKFSTLQGNATLGLVTVVPSRVRVHPGPHHFPCLTDKRHRAKYLLSLLVLLNL